MVAMAAGSEVLVGEQNGSFYAKVSGAAPHAGATGVTQAGTIDASGGQGLLGAGGGGGGGGGRGLRRTWQRRRSLRGPAGRGAGCVNGAARREVSTVRLRPRTRR